MSIQAKLIAGILTLLALAGSGVAGFHFGNVYGANSEKVGNQAADLGRKDAIIKTLRATAEQNRQLAVQQAANAKQENENHEKELADLRARLRADSGNRVRIDPAKFCGGNTAGSAQAAAAGGSGQADAGAAFLPESFAGDLRRLAADADEVTADLRTLKARVELSGCFAGP